MRLIVATDYSKITGLRYCNISDFSAEDFYHKKLNAAFKDAYDKQEQLEMVIDGTIDGGGPSFLDESIGNLVYDFTLEHVKRLFRLVSEREPMWINLVETRTYPKWEGRRLHNQEPKVTESHPAWWRLVNGVLNEKIWLEPKTL